MTAPRLASCPALALRVSLAVFAVVLGGSLALFAGCGLSTGGIPAQDGGVACTATSPCDDQDPCTADACSTEGICTFTPVDNGAAPAALQVPGDCQSIQCTGGKATTIADDSDVPSNANTCIAESCVMGVPTQALHQNDAQPCTMMGAPGACQGGVCTVTCKSATDCPVTSTCATALCDGVTGTCSYTNVADGTPTPMVPVVVGDCHVSICVGGVAVDEVDPSDVPAIPADQAGCADAVCSATGTPSNPVHPLDSVCSTFMGGSPGHCDPNGHCVECVTGSDCPGNTDDCQRPSCTNNTCGMQLAAAGTLTSGNPAQIPGDCHQVECDGAGNHSAVVDDTDAPASGTVCVTDTCSSGIVMKTDNPSVPCGTAGGMQEVCNATGQCGCQSNADCTLPSTCFADKVCNCTPSTCTTLGKTCGGPFSDGCYAMLGCDDTVKDGNETDVDCGGTTSKCATRCGNGKKCGANGDCQSGFCADGVCCNTACTGSTCQACSAAAKGQGVDGVCGAVKLGTDPHSDCASQAVSTCGTTGNCNGSGACSTWPVGSICQASKCNSNVLTTAEQCAGGACTVEPPATVDCSPYKCGGSPAACPTTCTVDTDCINTTFYCSANHCVAKQAGGNSCSAPDQCSSGVCGTTGSGNCCNATCAHLGGTCGATGCDSTGACVYPGSTTTCGSATCSNVTYTPPSTCGGGTCNPSTPMTCPNEFACSGTSCATTCTAPTLGCASGYACVGGNSCLLAAGQACSANTACASGFCDVDGTGNCCSAACTMGSPCGATSCNNLGACVYPSVSCSSASCVGSVLTTDTTCFNGTCSASPMITTCSSNLSCAGGSCPLGCGTNDATGDMSCVTAFWCNGVGNGACMADQLTGSACTRDGQCILGCDTTTSMCK